MTATMKHGGYLNMASLTLRNVDESLKTKLRVLAAANHRSMEEEARQILRHHLLRERCIQGVGTKISQRFAALGGIELPEMKRSFPRGLESDHGSNP
jgi:antitoxin FitA